MLNISRNPDYKLRLVGHGYHTSNRGKKYVRVLRMNDLYFVRVKLLAHKDLHILYKNVVPYQFIGDWLEIKIYGYLIAPCEINNEIDKILDSVWFE